MRSNGKIVALAVVLAALTIGVGYAAINTVNLVVTGTATAATNQANFTVKFTGTPTCDNAQSKAAIEAGTNDLSATLSVAGMDKKGDTVVATYPITNASADLSANLEVATKEITGQNPEYFSIDTSVVGSLKKGETGNLVITVTLIKTPIDVEPRGDINVKVNASPVQPQ